MTTSFQVNLDNASPDVVAQTSIAIVGYGYWGQILAKNIADSGAAKIVAIVESQEGSRKAAKEAHPKSTVVASLDEALNMDEVEVVVIATPVSGHFPIAKAALEANKHVFVEKPFVRKIEEAHELKQMAEERDLHIFVDHTFLFTGEVIAMKEIVEEGRLGDIVMIDSCRMNFGKFQPDVNVTWDLAPHDLSIIRHLVKDEVVNVSSDGSDCMDRGIEDTVSTALQFRNKLSAYLHHSWISPQKERRMTITGTKAMMIYDDANVDQKIKIFDHQLVEHVDGSETSYSYQHGDVHVPRTPGGSALAKEFKYVSQVVAGQREHDTNTVDDAIWVLDILLRSSASLEQTS